MWGRTPLRFELPPLSSELPPLSSELRKMARSSAVACFRAKMGLRWDSETGRFYCFCCLECIGSASLAHDNPNDLLGVNSAYMEGVA